MVLLKQVNKLFKYSFRDSVIFFLIYELIIFNSHLTYGFNNKNNISIDIKLSK